MLTIGPFNDLPRVRHAFFTRQGGISEGVYASLNCGFGSGDDREHVAENRRRAMAKIDMEAERLVTSYQVHSADVAHVTEPWPPSDRPRVDAMVTDRRGIALGILTADCAPVILIDPDAQVIGAVHAGWKGALNGVLAATVSAMLELGARPRAIQAGIGPCIAQRSYEVGPEFAAAFLEQDRDNATFFQAGQGDRQHFDLRGYVARRLVVAGVGAVRLLPCDTYAEADRFFSYRRAQHLGERDYGRGLSLVCLEP